MDHRFLFFHDVNPYPTIMNYEVPIPKLSMYLAILRSCPFWDEKRDPFKWLLVTSNVWGWKGHKESPGIVYLPTFTRIINQIWVNILYIECLGIGFCSHCSIWNVDKLLPGAGSNPRFQLPKTAGFCGTARHPPFLVPEKFADSRWWPFGVMFFQTSNYSSFYKHVNHVHFVLKLARKHVLFPAF